MSKRKVTHYTLEFKQSSVNLALELDQSIGKTAKDLNIKESTLHGWVTKYGGKLASKTGKPEDCVYEELKRLRKENHRLKQERDILKKATAYFAREIL